MSKVNYATVVTYVKCNNTGEYDENAPCPFHDDHGSDCRFWASDDDGCYNPEVRKLLGVSDE